MSIIEELYHYTKDLNILFVEDDEQLRFQMTALFDELFNEVDTANNGQEGLQKHKKRLDDDKKPYDLIITDINMPKMNGIEMIHAIHEDNSFQPIVVVSAHNESDYLMELLHEGVNSFLIKPVKHEDLINTLYKISKAISNEKLIEKHYCQIADLNTELSLQSKALKKSNDELKKRNSALERSMRIIEGMHHKDQLHRNINVVSTSSGSPSIKSDDLLKDLSVSKKGNHLENIERLINNIVLEHPYKKMDKNSFELLSDAVRLYADSITEAKTHKALKKTLKSLSIALENPPHCSSRQEFERALSILESFFFIYAKWQQEWKNIDDDKFEVLSRSIEDEIVVLTEVWTSKS